MPRPGRPSPDAAPAPLAVYRVLYGRHEWWYVAPELLEAGFLHLDHVGAQDFTRDLTLIALEPPARRLAFVWPVGVEPWPPVREWPREVTETGDMYALEAPAAEWAAAFDAPQFLGSTWRAA